MSYAEWRRGDRSSFLGSVQVACTIFFQTSSSLLGSSAIKLRERARSGHAFALDDLTIRLTVDVILKVIMYVPPDLPCTPHAKHKSSGADLDHQNSDNIIATALAHITKWHSFGDPRVLAHPLRPLVQGYYGRLFNKWIHQALHEKFAEMKRSKQEPSSRSKRAKFIIIIQEAYLETKKEEIPEATKLDNHFTEYLTYQLRLFLFAGTHTTSSSIAYVYHLLSKHPEALAQVRQEHDRSSGPDPSAVAQLLCEQPALLNQCPYTMAVIKETLRLYPPAGTMRQRCNGQSLTDRHGNEYPLMDDISVTVLHQESHHNPRV